MNINVVCSYYVVWLCDEHKCRMFILCHMVMWWTQMLYAHLMLYGYVMNINVVCSSYVVWIVNLLDICITLWWWGHVSNFATTWYFFSHIDDDGDIATMELCSSHCDDMTFVYKVAMWWTKMSYVHHQPRSSIVMFITLWQYGYVCHIVCSSYKAMFFTLWQYA